MRRRTAAGILIIVLVSMGAALSPHAAEPSG
jgi:hypothetical protein